MRDKYEDKDVVTMMVTTTTISRSGEDQEDDEATMTKARRDATSEDDDIGSRWQRSRRERAMSLASEFDEEIRVTS